MNSIKSYFKKKNKKNIQFYSVNPINVKIIKKGYIDPKDIEITTTKENDKNIADNQEVILTSV